MKESYREGPASHRAPESCVRDGNSTGEASTGAHAGQVLSCEINLSRADAVNRSGRQYGRGSIGEVLICSRGPRRCRLTVDRGPRSRAAQAAGLLRRERYGAHHAAWDGTSSQPIVRLETVRSYQPGSLRLTSCAPRSSRDNRPAACAARLPHGVPSTAIRMP